MGNIVRPLIMTGGTSKYLEVPFTVDISYLSTFEFLYPCNQYLLGFHREPNLFTYVLLNFVVLEVSGY